MLRIEVGRCRAKNVLIEFMKMEDDNEAMPLDLSEKKKVLHNFVEAEVQGRHDEHKLVRDMMRGCIACTF